LLDHEARPVALIAWRGAEGKGSARAPAGFNVHAALSRCKDLLVEFGGHARAAGFTLRRERFEAFRARLLECIATDPRAERKRLTIEGALPLSACDPMLARAIADLGPFGVGNEEPLFAVEGVQALGPAMAV